MQEDIIAKLIDYLVAPKAAKTALLAEQEKVYYISLSFQLCSLTQCVFLFKTSVSAATIHVIYVFPLPVH
jgi:hypothetical protein